MADTAAQRQSANARGGDDSAGRRHPEDMRGMIDIAPGATAADSDRARRWINTRIFYRTQIDDQAVITNSQASRVMAPATDRDQNIILSREIYRTNYVRYICATRDETRLLVDHPVIHLASFIIVLVSRLDQFAAQVCFEIGDGIFVEHAEVSLKQS